ncbi:hypothetical protein MPTK2_7g11050 [Marchantia polymorpha subsp. ruderalis]
MFDFCSISLDEFGSNIDIRFAFARRRYPQLVQIQSVTLTECGLKIQFRAQRRLCLLQATKKNLREAVRTSEHVRVLNAGGGHTIQLHPSSCGPYASCLHFIFR